MLKYMLDTPLCIFTLKHRPDRLRQRFNEFHGQLCISTVTLMELICGAEQSTAVSRNLEQVEGFAQRLAVLDYDTRACAHSGQLCAELARQGRSLTPYQQMIAGHARSQGLILVTCGRSDIQVVPGLRYEEWAA